MLAAVAIGAVCFVLLATKAGWQFDAVLSGSMEPVMHVGGLVVVRPVNVDTLKVGDIISFTYDGMTTPICHRIHAIEYIGGVEYFQTKGDANNAPEQDPVPLGAVHGKVIVRMPYVGRLLDVSRVGRTPVYMMGRRLPAAAAAIAGMGLIFMGLTLKDPLLDVLWPGNRMKKDMLKKSRDIRLRRARLFKLT